MAGQLHYGQRAGEVEQAVYMHHRVPGQFQRAPTEGLGMRRAAPRTGRTAPPPMPAAWACTRALLAGLGAYGVVRAAAPGAGI